MEESKDVRIVKKMQDNRGVVIVVAEADIKCLTPKQSFVDVTLTTCYIKCSLVRFTNIFVSDSIHREMLSPRTVLSTLLQYNLQ